MKLLLCAVYLAFTGMLGFLLGRWIPKGRLKPEEGLFRCFEFEKNGAVYEKLGIRKWQNRLPDMSRIFPSMMPAKNLSGDFEKRLPVMILETCVAEITHSLLCVAGLGCIWICPGWGGVAAALIDIVLLNLPFILIQRYNRPRLLHLQQKLQEKEGGAPCVY